MKINGVVINDKEISESSMNLSADALAELFWNMDEREQANFFCHLGDKDHAKISHQLAALYSSNQLTQNGREVIHLFGQLSEQ